MPPENTELAELLDLKMLPAWVKEPAQAKSYAHYEGEEERERRPRGREGNFRREGGRKRPTSNAQRRTPKSERGDRRPEGRRPRHERGPRRDGARQDRPREAPQPLPEVTVRFVPFDLAFQNVAAQIKDGAFAYSLFALARLFLEKPERYHVQVAAKAESPLYQLGENGALALDRQFLENNSFHLARDDFYKIDITQAEPIKGNFTSVARCRLSGTLLGPTNHHAYQPRLRTLYEQRFSRRMSFAEYQRKIEILNDPALVEQWKEEARAITTFTTLREETPLTFANVTEAERHFRKNYLPTLVRTVAELTLDGVTSRKLGDRVLGRLIEDRWSAEARSPSQMMQELASRFREAELHIFRHRRGMLFVSPIRPRPFKHEEAGVSPQVTAVLETIGANPRINRKDLAEKIVVDLTGDEVEARKLALAADLKWLISAGYVIEFNDGSLDLPRVKAKAAEKKEEKIPAEVVSVAKDTPGEDREGGSSSPLLDVASGGEAAQ